MMTPDDKFFSLIGRVMTGFALMVVVILTTYALVQLYKTDQSYLYDDTPLQAPDTAKTARPK